MAYPKATDQRSHVTPPPRYVTLCILMVPIFDFQKEEVDDDEEEVKQEGDDEME